MTIQYVGGVSGNRVGTTSSTTQSISGTLTGGLASSPSDGDLVVVAIATGTQARTPAMAVTTPAGYANRGQQNQAADTQDVSMDVSWKFYASGDGTTVTIPSSGNTADGQAWAIMVFRGVHRITPFDVADTTAVGQDTGRPNPASITPTTAGAWIVTACGGGSVSGSVFTFPDMDVTVSANGVDTNDGTVSLSYNDGWTSGAFDPAVTTTGANATSDSWCARTMALRPAPDDLSTYTDTFTSGTLNSTTWPVTETTGGGTSAVAIVSGELQLQHDWDITNGATWPPARTAVYSKPGVFGGGRVYWRYKPLSANDGGAGNAHKATVAMGVIHQTNLEGPFFHHAPANGAAGTLTVKIANNLNDEWWQDVGTIASYNPNGDHAWLGVRSDGTNFYFDTAPDSSGSPGTWTERFSYANNGTGVSFDDLNALLFGEGRIHFRAYHWEDTYSESIVTADPRFDGVNTSTTASVNTNSDANPASYTLTAAAAKDHLGSRGVPATYTWTVTAAKDHLGSKATPATYTLTGFTALGEKPTIPSAADPASFLTSVSSATDLVAVSSVALPATYTLTGVAATGLKEGQVSVALPADYVMAATMTTDVAPPIISVASPAVFTMAAQIVQAGREIESEAVPAAYTWTVTDATSIYKQNVFSQALPAGYTFTPSTSANNQVESIAVPATYVVTVPTTEDETTGEEETFTFDPPSAKAPLTEIEFLAWLEDETAIRVVLVETQCVDENGNTELLYFGSRGFVTKSEDGQNARAYLPLMMGGLDFKQTVSLDLNGDQSYGDIELDNTEGDLDYLFDRVWRYQPCRAYVGDATWPRRDFRQIFDGVVEDIDSSDRGTVNVKLRDKLYRLEMPLHEGKVGGNSPDSDRLLPVCFGECHNVTPVLKDAQLLQYVYHAREAETPFEVRDNGVPVLRTTAFGAPATFSLPVQPAGRITASVQGDKGPDGYINQVGPLVRNIVMNWGTESLKRFTDNDIDQENYRDFNLNVLARTGLYVTDRMTVLEAAQSVAASAGARLTMTALGKMQLIRVQVPPFGTPIVVDEAMMEEGSLRIVNRLSIVASVRLGYCKNWTIQEDTASGLPEEHKALYSREWLSVTAVNDVTRERYNLWSEPEQENCLLLTEDDAIVECQRRASLRTYQRHVYEFRGFSELIFTRVGAPMTLKHRRFGLQNGKTGQVVAVAVNWLDATVTIQVVV